MKRLSISSSVSAAVYGLSTEGYRIASSIAVKGGKVSLVDESVRMAITLKPDVARTYPNVASLIEDEPLLGLEPVDLAISDASYVYFAPRVRKVGQEAKGDIMSKFKDATKALKRGASVIYTLPTGLGGNDENIALIEHVTGMTVGKDISYYYMPIGTEPSGILSDILVGTSKGKNDGQISKMLYDPSGKNRINFVDINSAEMVYAIRTVSHYAGIASILEICKGGAGRIDSGLMQGVFKDLFIDDITSGLYDLRAIWSSLDGASPLTYLVNGSIKGIEGYVKHLIDEVRMSLKKRDLKASRTKVAIAWTLDSHEMRGDRIELLSSLESKLKDYIGDVEQQHGHSLDLYNTEKTTVVIACSKQDFSKVTAKNRQSQDLIIMKANPLCEIEG